MNQPTPYPRFRWWVLLAVAASSVCSGMVMMSFAPLIGNVARDLGVDLGTASFGILGLTMFVLALGTCLFGFVIDRVGIFPVIIVCQLLILLSNSAIPFIGNHFGSVVLIRIVQGIGGGGLSAAITPALALWFPRHEMGRAMGSQAIGIPLGIMLGLNAAPMLSRAFGGWKEGIGMLSALPLLALIMSVPIAAMSRRYRPAISDGERKKEAVPASEFLRLPVFWVGLITMCLCIWVGIPFGSLIPGFLAVAPPAGAGFGPAGAGRLMLFFTLMGIAGAPLGGFLVDKVFNGRNRPVIVIGWVLSAVFYTAIMFPAVYSRPFALMTVLLLAGLANPFLNVTLMSFAAKVFSPLVVGRVCGLWMSVSFFAGSAGVMAGSLALRATGTYELSILIIGASSVLGLVVSLFLRQSPTAPSQMGHLAFNGEKIAEEL